MLDPTYDVFQHPQIESLKDQLYSCWKELGRMMFCSKLPLCVLRFRKIYRVGGQEVHANLIESMALNLQQIKEITSRLQRIKMKRFDYHFKYFSDITYREGINRNYFFLWHFSNFHILEILLI